MGIKSRLTKLEKEQRSNLDKDFLVCFKYPDTNEMEIPLLNFKGTIEEGDKLLNGRRSYIVYIGVVED